MKLLLLTIYLLCIMASPPALAHSTAGLQKEILRTDTLTIDHVAFYLERKVGKRIDEAGRRGRYYIDTFLRIEQDGRLARVHATVRDQKTSKLAKETFLLRKNPDDTWDHISVDGKVISNKIYHYVKKNRPKIISTTINTLLAALALFLGIRVIMDRFRKPIVNN